MTQTLTSTPTSQQGLGAAPASVSSGRAETRRFPRWLLIAAPTLLLVVGSTWATVGWRRAMEDQGGVDRFTVASRTFNVVLSEKGELKAAKATEIVCEVEGRSTIISLIPEGTAVTEGDLLVELASDQIEDRIQKEELNESNTITAHDAAVTELEILRDKNESDIRKAKLKIELSQLALEKYEKGDWVELSKDADIAIEQAKINLERRTEDFEAAKKLWGRGFITKPEYNEDEFSFQRAGWDLEKALRAKTVLQSYTHVADLRQRQSDLEESKKEFDRVVKNAEAEEIKKIRAVEGKKKELDLTQSQLRKLRRQKQGCRIVAPTQGFVVYYSGGGRHFMSSDNQIREGATVYERQVILTLPDTTEMLVVVRVHEAKTNKLQLGQRARVRVEGVPGEEFTGRVTKIAVVADTQNRWLNPDLKEYETEITLDPTDVPLKPGVTAHAELLVETVEDKLAVPVQAIYSKGRGRFVFQYDGQSVMPMPIQVGAIGTEWAEIVGGLTGGERILLAYTDEHKRLVPDAVTPDGSDDGDKHRNGGPVASDGGNKRRRGQADGQTAGKPESKRKRP